MCRWALFIPYTGCADLVTELHAGIVWNGVSSAVPPYLTDDDKTVFPDGSGSQAPGTASRAKPGKNRSNQPPEDCQSGPTGFTRVGVAQPSFSITVTCRRNMG